MFTKTFRLLCLVGALFFSYKSYAQPAFVAQNVKGSCGGFNNGSFEVLVTAGTGSIEIFYFGGGPFFGGPIPATIGTPVTITGLAGAAFPGRPYTIIVQDAVSSAGGLVNIITYPTPITATVDDVDDNTDCVVSNGSIAVTPSGGSGAYVYSWEETTLGYTATTQDITGLLGGNYELTITDLNTNCITVLPPIAVANPSPVLYTITNPSPVIICSGSNWILNLNGSEAGATYEVFRNNLIATGITQVGTGSPLNFTIPFASFSNGDNFKIRATNGICVGDMTGIIVANKVPLPTAAASGGGSVCAGSPLPNVTFTFTGTAPFTFTYTNGVTPVTVNNHPTTTFTIANAPAGTYQVTALTDANTCVATSLGSSVSVITNTRPTAAISGGGSICTGSALPSVTFTFTGTAPFTFTYTNGVTPVTVTNHPGTTFTIANAPAGTYSITALTDATTCTATSLGTPVSVIVRPLPTVASATGGGTLCAGGALPSVSFTLTGTPPFNLTYTDGVTPVIVNNHPTTTFTIPAASAGAYRITALRDANNCVATSLGGTVNVIVNPLPTATISGGGPVCAGAPLPNVVFTFTGRAPFNFTYTNGVTPVTVNNHPTSTFTIANAPAGTYSVTALRDANTCVATSLGTPVNVVVNTLPTAATSGGGTLCTGAPLPNVTFTFTGTAPFTFTYTNGVTPVTVNNHPSTTFTLTNAPAGTYRVTALTGANGCAATNLGGNVSVIVNPLPTATISGGGPVCAGAPLPNVVFTFTGTAPFNFTYTNGVTPVTVNNHPTSTFTIANAPAGTYSVTSLTDANTCVATSFGTPVTVTVNALPTAVTSGGGTVCAGSPLPNVVFTFTGAAPFTFTYTNGVTPVTVNNHPTTTFTLTNAPAGTYRVTALTAANGCAATSLGGSVTVVVNPRPTAVISGGGPVCAGAPLPNVVFTFTGTAPFNFTYTNGVTPVTVNNHPTATFTIANAPAGTYSVTALTDANTCVATSLGTPVTVAVNALPAAVTSGGGTVCTGSPLPNVVFTFTGTAPFTFTYTNGVTPVTVNNHPTTTFTLTNAPAGTYRVTALTAANSCAATSLGGSVSVVVNPRPTAAISGGGSVCGGAPLPNVVFTFTGTAPFTFTYTNGVTPVTVNNHPTATFTIANAPAGTYSVTSLTDANTCVATSFGTPVAVTVNALPTAVTSGGGTVCTGSPLPNVVFTFTGTAPFTFTYTNGTTPVTVTNHPTTTFTIPNAPVGTYQVTALSNASCTATSLGGSVSVVVSALPTAAVSGGGQVCSGAPLPNIVFTFTGTAPFTFTYTNGVTPVTVTNHPTTTFTIPTAPAGTYSVTALRDANTCVATNLGTPVSVIVNALPTAVASGGGSVCTGSPLPNVTFTFTGTAPFTFTYTDGTTPVTVNNHPTTTFTLTNAPAGIYQVTALTDASSCAATSLGSSVSVVNNPAPTITGTGVAPICAGVVSASLTYTGTTGTPDQYSIDFNAAAEAEGFVDVVNAPLPSSPISIVVPATVAAVTYNATLTVRNATTGCTSTPLPISIQITPSPTATISGNATICSGSPTNITVTFTGTSPWAFQYSDGTTTSPVIPSFFNSINIPVNPSTTTTYTLVSVDDGTVCAGIVSGSAVVTVNQNPLTNLAVGVTLSPLCSGGISDVTVANSEVGVSYQLRNDADDSNIGTAVIGTGATINLSTGVLLTTTTFNVLATATGCAPVQLATLATVNVTGAINDLLVTMAVDNPICAGSATNIQVLNSENGVLYQLRNDSDDSPIGAAVAGTGGTINLPTGNLLVTTNFNVLASNGTCSIELTNLETVGVGPAADPSLAVGVTLDPLCIGGATTITVALSQLDVTYQLRNDADDSAVGSAVIGTGATISLPTGILNATTTFNILATSAGCPPVELTALATVNVSGNIDATLPLAATASPICQGTGTNIEIDNSEVGVSYQLRNDATDAPVGAAVVGTGVTILLPTGNLAATTTFNVLATNGACSLELTDLETVTVDAAPNPALTVAITLNPLCVGGTSAVTVDLSQLGVSYQLRNDADDSNVGTAVIGTGGTISLSTGVLNATTVFNILASSGVCAPVELATLATVNVSGTVNAGLTLTASATPICAGSSTFIQVQASEAGVNYQLRNDLNDATVGAAVAGNGATINLPTGNLAITTTFNVVASNGTCSIELTELETITVNPSPAINLAVTSASALICPGASTNIIVAGSELGVSYQLRNNIGNVPIGSPVAGTGSNILLPTGALTVNTGFNVLATGGATCSAQLTATAAVSIRPVGDPACGGGGSDCTNFSSIQPSIVTQPSCNDRDAGEVSFTISRSDGTPTTFRVIWSFNSSSQTKFTSNTVSFDDLSSGLYQYTVIDEGNGKSCGPVDFFLDLKTQVEILDKQVTSNVTCFGGSDGNAILSVDGSTTGEYWYKYVLDGVESGSQIFTPGAPLPGGLPADDNDFIIIKVDETFAFSCPDTVMVRIKHTYAKIDFTVASTEVTTCNGTDGAIQVAAISGGDSGANPLQIRLKMGVPFSTDPSGYIVLVDYENVSAGAKEYTALAQGNYVVDVKDHLDCIQSKAIAVQAPGQVPLSSVGVVATDATCTNEGESGSIKVTISEAGIYKVALSQDQATVPDDDQFVDYNSPSLPSFTFNNLIRGVYYLYLKSSTTTCPTRTDAIVVGGVQAVGDFDIVSSCENVNITANNITGQQDAPFVIRVFSNSDKFFKIDSLSSSNIPLSNSVSFINSAPSQHSFLVNPGTYRFVMVQTQTTGAGTCTLVSDTIVYDVRQGLGIVLGEIKPSFPEPKRTGSIEIENIVGGTRFVSDQDELYYEISLSTADDDIVVFDWAELKLNPQNKFSKLFDFLLPGVYRIKVRDASGCVKTQDVEISLDPSVYVPNIFTPNDDSANDQFEVLNLPLTGKHKLIVTNRWGNEVFKSNDYREGTFWDGNETSDGIYFYRLQVEGGDTYTGWVEIMRGTKP